MAKRKREVAAEYVSDDHHWMIIWCDASLQELEKIEGVTHVQLYNRKYVEEHRWRLSLDPRYDAQEILGEIIEKFSMPIPDVFKEEI